mmetsp:Transcript_13462/g.19809  ORF Transcript_13462/g.19809 Transcript_13462/m.19809 type:complete len:87 (-) Transcript_13462:172-432(-)
MRYDTLVETAKAIESRLWLEAGGDILLYQDRSILAARMGEVSMPEYRTVENDETTGQTTAGSSTTYAPTPVGRTATSILLTDNRYR